MLATFCRGVFISLILASVAAQAQAQFERPVFDTEITFAVERQIARDEALLGDLIDVQTEKGIVTLTGLADNLLAYQRAEEVASTIRGVRAVVNRLVIRPVIRSDTEIRQSLLNALRNDPATDSYQIRVDVKSGTATLTGTVDSYAERMLSEGVASGIKGIKAIRNLLTVKSTSADRADAEIKADIERMLKSNVWVNSELIEVQVQKGAVTLAGSVGSAYAKSRAYAIAWVKGVKSVQDEQLKIKDWAGDAMRRKHRRRPADAEIQKAVEDAFFYDPRVLAFQPKVSVLSGVITLTGTVDNLAAKRAAEKDARNTIGARLVRNYMKVRPVQPPTDQQIAETLKNRFLGDASIDGYRIRTTVRNGVVWLHGAVDSLFERERAENLAAQTRGVIAVRNRLSVLNYDALWSVYEDPRIKAAIEDEYQWSPFVEGDRVQVTVYNGVATLTGNVKSESERHYAETNAYEAGARRVVNLLEVAN